MRFLVRIDDVCEHIDFDNFKRYIKVCAKYGITGFLGVIPNCKDEKLIKYPYNKDVVKYIKLLEKKGWEISLHGYEHLYNQGKGGFMNSSKSEFIGLPESIQSEKIRKGINILRQKGFTKVESFFAPSHGYDLATINALKKNQIKILLDGYKPFLAKENDLITVSCIVDLPKFNLKKLNTTHIVCVHTNTMNDSSFLRYENFMRKNKDYFLSPKEIENHIFHNTFYNKILETSIYYLKKYYKKIKK